MGLEASQTAHRGHAAPDLQHWACPGPAMGSSKDESSVPTESAPRSQPAAGTPGHRATGERGGCLRGGSGAGPRGHGRPDRLQGPAPRVPRHRRQWVWLALAEALASEPSLQNSQRACSRRSMQHRSEGQARGRARAQANPGTGSREGNDGCFQLAGLGPGRPRRKQKDGQGRRRLEGRRGG